jgi:hypothetical protein
MDIGSIFLVLGLFVLVALFVTRPFMEKKSVAVSKEEHDLSALLAEKDRTLTTLQELEFDHLLGKVPEEDYPALRASMMQRGADILRKIDEIQPPAVPTAVDERLEAAITARRRVVAKVPSGGNGSNGVHVPDDSLEQMIAVRRRGRQEKSGGFCPKCGSVVQQSDRFCPKCGASMV